MVVYEIITFFLSTLINTPVHCTYCWCGLCSMVWLHSWSWWVRWLSSMGRIRNDRLTFETTGLHAKWRAHVQNDGLACEMRGSCSKRRARVQNDGLTFEMIGSRAKRRAHVRNDGPACEMRAHVRNDGLTCEMRGSCSKWRCLREYRFTRGSPDQSIIGLFLFVLWGVKVISISTIQR